MTKKDYELIATAFYPFCTDKADGNIACSKEEKYGVHVAAVKMAHVLQTQNPKFNINRFLKACGVGNAL